MNKTPNTTTKASAPETRISIDELKALQDLRQYSIRLHNRSNTDAVERLAFSNIMQGVNRALDKIEEAAQ